ncbi:MAG: dihydrofolate reductase family protein [Dehalococcoidia bacterium]
MAKVRAEMSMSLDGFITGPNDSVDDPLGKGGDRLHQWVYGLEPWGEDPPFKNPVFVVTHNPRQPLLRKGGTTFNFVDGIEAAVEQAKAAAGDKDVSVAGGANVIQQLIEAGLLDEIQIHLAPVLLGEGRRLFENMESRQREMELTRLVESPGVTHLRFWVAK